MIRPKASIVDALRRTAARRPERRAFTFLAASGEETDHLTFGRLERRARAVATRLATLCPCNGRALLLLTEERQFLEAFFGCLFAGVIAVPAYPPHPRRRDARLEALVADCEPGVVVTSSSAVRRLRPIVPGLEALGAVPLVIVDDVDDEESSDWTPPDRSEDDIAFLQYTSGSTGTPRGVVVSHANLLHNESLIRRTFGQTEDSVVVGWLPLFHDMGLIGNALQPVYNGSHCVLMAPVTFLQKPILWLEAITGYRGTTSGGPDFAYQLCLRKVAPDERERLDLSSWRVAFNGAEPVRAETVSRFAEYFAPCGFRRKAFFPCYGLAEATLLVSGTPDRRGPRIEAFDAEALAHRHARSVGEGDAPVRLVSSGRLDPEQEIAVVDPDTGDRCEDGRVGEIWVRGPSVARGYWNHPQATAETFDAVPAGDAAGGYLRTGDLGFVRDSHLFVTGRLKDLIIVRGRNYYPQDIELAVERSHQDCRPGGTAAFSVEMVGEERLVVVQEIARRPRATFEEIALAAREAVAAEHELRLHRLVLLRPGILPKTSSGKVRRRACATALEEGTLEVAWDSGASPPGEDGQGAKGAAGSRTAILELDSDARLTALCDLVRARAAAVLRVPVDCLAPEHSLAGHGLDSLGAAELKAELEGALGVDLPFGSLLDGTTLTGVATALARELDSPPAPPSAEAEAGIGAEGQDLPLSQGQRALWYLQRVDRERGTYNVVAAAEVEPSPDAAALRRAFEGVVARHSQLRATFHERDGEPVHRVADRPEVDFVERSLLDDEELRLELVREGYRPFDLERGPLVRVRLYRRPGGGSAVLVAIHHIVADFVSLWLLAREVGESYRTELVGETARLPAPKADFADFVRWQQAYLSSDRRDRDWAYWREALSGELPTLDLPTDRPRPPVRSDRGGACYLRLGRETADDLKGFARSEASTLHTALIAAFQTLLHRMSGQDEILVGSPAAGRPRRELWATVGYLVNPLVLRGRFADGPTFRQAVERARAVGAGALEHQELPFPFLVERLERGRDPSRSPLFQAMLVFHRMPHGPRDGALGDLGTFALGEAGGRLTLGDLALRSIRLPEVRVQCDLTLLVADREDGLVLSLHHDASLFDRTTAARMLGRLGRLLAAGVRDPERPVRELPFLAAGERHQILVEWNDTESGDLPRRPLHAAFETCAGTRPDAVAVVRGSQHLSYGELDRRANRLAHWLRALGVALETRVGVASARTVNLPVALLAVLKAGGAYVPLDPGYPEARLRFLMTDAGIELVVAEESLADRLPVGERRLVTLDPHGASTAAEPAVPPGSGAELRSLAYLIYTSGSTGRPKGVAIEHRSAAVFLRWAREAFGPRRLSRVLAGTSIGFDLSIFELFAPLTQGGTVVMADSVLDLDGLPGADRISLVNTVPSVISELLAKGGLPPGPVTVNLAGEPLPASLAAGLHGTGAVTELFNLYGPSESTTYATWAPVGPAGPPAIGRPVDGTRAHLLDPAGAPVGLGQIGELSLGGSGLGRCYLGRPGFTAERFVPDPLTRTPGGRLYRTGDLARHRVDGSFDYLGRIDHQVKLRGFRIEPGEIETVLTSHPRIREAAVVVEEMGDGAAPDRRLVAYPVFTGQAMTSRELRRFLRERLPDYMVPSVFVPLDQLPLTPHGKLDRRALPAPSPREERRGAAARTETEARIAAIWAEVLGCERVAVDQDFFELGGHSLLAVRVLARVEDAFEVRVPLGTFLRAPTVAALAERVDGAPEEAPLPCLLRADRREPLPPSFSQERLWFLQELERWSCAYHVPNALVLEGRLDLPSLARALARAVRRHEALRTRFPTSDGAPRQEIVPRLVLELPLADLSALGAPRRQAEARRALERASRIRFDLRRGPLVRLLVLRLAREEHVLLVVLHHTIADGLSLELLLREVSELYAADRAGRPAGLPELRRQYADFAVWQRKGLEGALERDLGYWRDRLDGAPILDLPADRPRPAVADSRGALYEISLPEPLVGRLRRGAQDHGVSPYTVLLAALCIVLGRHAGEDDVSVGSPIATRPMPETESMVGPLINTVVLRADLTGPASGAELLARLRDRVLEAQGHADLPFERLVEELQPDRSLAHSPLFQVMLAHFAAGGTPSFAGLATRPLLVDTGTAKFDLTVWLTERDDRIGGWINYRTSLFDRTTVARFADHLQRALEGLLERPEARIATLSLLAPAERQQLLVESTGVRLQASSASLDERVAAAAREVPDRIAVIAGGETLSFGELQRRVARVAAGLAERGARPEVVVGVFAHRAPGSIVAVLATLAAGASYLPVDPNQPPARLAAVLEDAAPLGLIDGGGGPHPRTVAGVPVWSPAELSTPLHSGRVRGPGAPLASPGMAAYVLYTSGSTGLPKGVVVRRGSVANLAEALDEAVYRHGPRRPLQVGCNAPLSVDASVKQLLQLGAAHTLHLVPEEVRRDGEALLAFCAARRLDVVDLTPSQLELLADAGTPDASWRGLPGTVLVGGEAIGAALWRRLASAPDTRFVNVYGPTECTVDVTAQAVTPPRAVPSLGRPLANVRTVLVDALLHPVPAGVTGELSVGGAGLARGYLARPGATAVKFVPDPFGGEPGGRLYRTGDLARWRPAGDLDFLGRTDNQVKLRGFRIELEEVDAALEAHEEVAAAAVVLAPGPASEDRLTGFVVRREGARATVAEIRAFLGQRLPGPMLPASLVEVDALPLSPAGKVDRETLGRWAQDAPIAPPAPEAARGPVEEVVAGIWTELLGAPPSGAHEDFFRAGGHSLLATRLATRLRTAFGIDLSLRRVFEEPTVAGLARAVGAALRPGAEPAAAPIPRSAERPTSLAFPQERVWFLDQLGEANTAYNLAYHGMLEGSLDVPAFAWSLDRVRLRQEELRARFPHEKGRPFRRIEPWRRRGLPVIDLRALPESARWTEARRIATADAAWPFDLACGPLLRSCLLRLDATRHLITLTLHHIVSDAWSRGVLFRDLSSFYRSRVEARPPVLDALPVRYADFAAWQRARIDGQSLQEDLEFWRGRLGSRPPVAELPTDRPRPPARSSRGGLRTRRLDGALVTRLHELARRESATLFMVILGGLLTVLHRYTGQDDLPVGTPVANRLRPEVEPLVGLFVNTLVLRGDLSGRPSFSELVRRTRSTTLDAYVHQELPFERLVEELQPYRDLGRSPLFQVMVVHQNTPLEELDLPGVTLRPLEPRSATAKFDLTLFSVPRHGELDLWAEYSTDLFDATTMERLLVHLEALLTAAARSPDAAILDLHVLTPAECQQVEREWGASPELPPGAKLIHEVFEARAERSPEAVALVAGRDHLSYAGLSARSDVLADRLRRSGIGPEDRVGLCLERSAALVVAVLGTLKAGGAYVPLDPEYPRERLRLIVQDAAPRVVLTEEGLADRLPVAPASLLFVDGTSAAETDPEAVAVARRAGPVPRPDPGNGAYLIYTSGSTGKPKGVEIEHRSAAAMVRWALTVFDASELSRMIASTSLSFDLSVFELFVPLAAGGTVVLVRDGLATATAPEAATATFLNSVPSVAAEIMRLGALPRSVGTVGLAGEPLPRALADALAAGSVRRLFNLYGPSEDTTYSTWGLVPRDEGAEITIGRPVAGTRARVLDATGRPTPPGVAGELFLAGSGLARGYAGDPRRTAQRFLPCPDGPAPGQRMYATGDLVSFRRDGQLRFHGRVDQQVKIRGFRVEPGEIEHLLAARPEVGEAAVLAVRSSSGSPSLVAYLTAADGAAVDVTALRNHLTASLPRYLVPASYRVLDRLPRSPNGKLDRRALEAVGVAGPEARAPYVAPRTPLEETVSAVWREVLGLERVGVHEDFFHVGGHSLAAVQVVARLREACACELPLRALYDRRTVEELASLVEEQQLAAVEASELEQLLGDLEALSDDEASRLLHQAAMPSEGVSDG